ncbi:MAG: riboflavin kinase, partial [Desulfobaccales bacterium]
RALLRLGKVEEARRLLGRPYGMEGQVVRGKGRGAKLLGVPTANIRPRNELLPASGIYAVRVRRGAAILPGVANIGTCPTFDGCASSLEVHLLDFDGDLYGEELGVDFVARLREERRFPSVEALAAQIHADIAAARKIL